uniref:FERM domain-containing protein n=1 Tax=Clastoptera arizonana TaxID=38151 RepID=A0A1B6BZW1_9HEMI
MRSSTVSAPVESCNLGQSPPHSRFAAVQLLTNQLLYFVVEPKSRTKELYNQTCSHLAAQGMADTELFGLATVSDGEYLFLDPDYKLSKYAPKNWRSSSTSGLDNNGKPLLIFHFRVQFYVESPLLLRDEMSKHHYYLQLRHNVLARGLLHACASEEVLYLLAGLALQADFGDYKDSFTNTTYFQSQDYFPQQMGCGGGESRIFQTASNLHRANRGLSQSEAESQFIREASSTETSPLTHNAHVYRLKHKKQDPGPGNVLLAICTRGIELYEENSTKALSGTLLWNDIGKLCFDRKKFEIKALNWPVSGEKLTYYTSSDEKPKHLLSLCRVTHQFSMTIQPRLVEVRRKEDEERKRYRDWGIELTGKLGGSHYGSQVCHRGDQRISVISSTSSNTTSGIVSDKVHSLDESEDDLELEIMINSPPAPSVESLALAHLQDTLSGVCEITPPSPLPTPDGIQQGKDCMDSPCTMTINAVKSSLISGAVTPATTDGSQCSSSCSTVVVAGTTTESISLKEDRRVVTTNRRPSTSSSLELGYSHTAQNSAISDTASTCLELDYSVQSAHTSSGVYTLRSSCGTTNTIANTVACSSETSGICVEESEGQRSRSGSIVSASGSFHGDGSDPSDAGQGTLLTAEELSDLIVGRSPKPRRGVYPSRATVSSTLDSDSDYVTLPPPPPPPPRSDSERQTNYALLESPLLSSPEETLATPLRLDDSLSNLALSSRKLIEESLLQQQIQFQHLASSFSPHKQNLHLNQYQISQPNHSPPAKSALILTNAELQPELNKLKYLNQPTIASSQYQTQYVMTNQSQSLDQPMLTQVIPQYQHLSAEEASARFITSKPHINILTAHTTLVPSTASPSFAAPTLAYQTSIPSCGTTQIRNYLPETRNYPLDPASRMKIKSHQNNSNLIPIVSSNNYLDVRGSGAAFFQHFHQKFPPPPPPVLHPRQPPPPPPPPPRRGLQTVYTSQVTRSQIEQFKQQLYSDVDYVIYPMQDPAISKQEYLDSKIALNHYNEAYPPPPYPSYSGKSHVVYRSTPNVAVASGYIPVSFNNHSMGPATVKYASNQNLSSEYSAYPGSSLSFLNRYPSSTSPLYSAAASYSSSSTQSLRYDPVIQMAVPKLVPPVIGGGFSRTQSDDNILNCGYEKPCLDVPKIRRPPPPLPPPYDLQNQLPKEKNSIQNVTPTKCQIESKAISQPSLSKKTPDAEPAQKNAKSAVDGLLDIRTLREKSRNMDLPLISALCNDRSLLKQTNAFVMPRHPTDKKSERPLSWHVETPTKKSLDIKNISTSSSIDSSDGTAKKSSLFSSFLSSKSVSNPTTPTKHSYSTSSSKLKYPVSGLSTTQIVKPGRKTTSRHTHPSDKLSGQTKVNRSRSTSSATSSTNVSEKTLPQ